MLNKLIRIITWKNKGKLFMISLLLAITIAMFSAMSISNEFLNKNISEVKNKYNAFDFIIKKEKDFSNEQLKKAENKYAFNSQIKEQKILKQNVNLPNFKPVIVFPNKEVQVEYKIQTYNSNDKISKPFIINGKEPQNENEIVVTKDLMDSMKKSIGSSINLKDQNYKITGTFGNPENQTKNTTFLTEKSVKKFPVLVTQNGFNKITVPSEQIIYSRFNDSNLPTNKRTDIYTKIMADKELQRSEKHDLFERKTEKITYDENQLCIGKEAVESFSKSKELSKEDFNKVKDLLEATKTGKCNVGTADTIGNEVTPDRLVDETSPDKIVNEDEVTSKNVNIGGNGQIVNAKPIDFAISATLNNKITSFISSFDSKFAKVIKNDQVLTSYVAPQISEAKSQMTALMNTDKNRGLEFLAPSLQKFLVSDKQHAMGSTLQVNAEGTAFIGGSYQWYQGPAGLAKLNAQFSLDNIKKSLNFIISEHANLISSSPSDVNISNSLPRLKQDNASDWTAIVNEYKAIYDQLILEKNENKTANENEVKNAQKQTENNKEKIVTKDEKTTKQKTIAGETKQKVIAGETKQKIIAGKKVEIKNVTKEFTYKYKSGEKTTYFSLLSSLIDFDSLKSSKIVKEQKEKQDVLNMVVFILLISALSAIVTTLITKIINNHKVEIGVLKAIGMKEEKITNSFLFIPIVILIAGFIMSFGLTSIFTNMFTKFYNQEFYLPMSKFFNINIISVILVIVIPLVVLLGYTFISVKYQVNISTLRLLANLGKKEKNKQINNPKLSMLMKQRINTLLQSNDKTIIVSIVSVIVTIFCAIFTLMLFSAWQNYDGIGSEIKTGSINAYKQNIRDTTHGADSINLHAFQIKDVYDEKFNHLDFIGKNHKISNSNPADLTVLGLNQPKSKYYDASKYKLDDLTSGLILPDKFKSLYGIEKGYKLKVFNDRGREFTLEVSGFQGKDNNLFAFTDNTYISAITKTFGKVNAHFTPNTIFNGIDASEKFVYLPTSAIEQSKKELLTILGIIIVGIIASIAIVIPLIAILVGNIYDDNKKIIATMKALGMSSKLIRQTVINPFLIIFAIIALITVIIVSTFIAPLFTDIFFNFIGRDIVYHNSIVGMLIVLIFVVCVYQLIILISTLKSNKIKPAKVLNEG